MKKNFLCVVMLLCLPVQVAHAVSIDTTGNSSSALIYPYYTINNNFESLVSIKNVNNDYKALKIRFHDSKLGLDIFDFSAFVPPSTSFNIRVLNDNKIGPSIFFNRSLCTLPTFPSGNIGLIHGVYDAIGQLDVSEGYIEVIEMGILESNALKNELSKGNCGILAEKNNSFDYHEDLVELGGMTQGGAESSNGFFYGSPTPKGMLAPSGGIQGSVVLNNTVSGESYTIQATGIADYSTRAQNYFAFNSNFYKLPSLASGSSDFTNKFWSTTSDFGLENTDSVPNPPVASGINPYPISHVLAKSELTTEYFSNSEVDVVTDWIITNPMYMHNIFREAPYNIIASTTETNGAVSPISFSPGKVQNKVLGRSVNVFSFGSNKSILGSANETKILLGPEPSSGVASLKINYNFFENHKGAPLIATAITRNKNLFNNTSTAVGVGFIEGNIFDACTGQPLENVDVNLSDDSSLKTDKNGQFQAKINNGIYTLKISPAGYGEYSQAVSITTNQARNISFPSIPLAGCAAVNQTSSYKAIIVAGTGPLLFDGLNHIWSSTQLLTDKAYKAFRLQGFSDENIYYMSADSNGLNRDVDDDGKNDIDSIANLKTLRYAITEWASDVEDVTVYLIGHGGVDNFTLGPDIILHSNGLKSQLDILQNKIKGKLSIVIDSCHSGSFISSLAANERYILASTGSNLKAVVAGAGGTNSFSYYFWDEIVFSGSLGDAFRKARAAVSRQLVGNKKRQKATLDTDGNGSETKNDYAVINQYCLGQCVKFASIAPTINTIGPLGDLKGQLSSSFTVNATIHNPIVKAWATFQRPDHETLLPSDGSAISFLPEVNLSCDGSVCQGKYDNFNLNGKYIITFYLKDSDGNTSIPKSIKINQSGRDGVAASVKAIIANIPLLFF